MPTTLHVHTICLGLVLGVASVGISGQSLPAMAPTAQSSPNAAAAVSPAPSAPLHAQVIYTNGQLQIRADNSSLNQILRSISHVTGLKITGGVEEQRVFGSYGPAPLSTVLATLLGGTGSNVLLLGGNAGTPPELILTSRTGGAELPGPNSPTYAMYDDNTDRSNAVPPPGNRIPGTPTPTRTPATTGPADGNTPASATPATPIVRAPGQPLTPEMVAQELMEMQAQQDQQKKALDEKIQQQQVEQNRKLSGTATQAPPAGSSTPQ